MKFLTLAAGVAVGYVLGTRAGREKYEQIRANARKLSSHPGVVQAQDKAKELLSNGSDAVAAKLAAAAPEDESHPAVPRPSRRKPAGGVATTTPLT
jgi:hypothetical protein